MITMRSSRLVVALLSTSNISKGVHCYNHSLFRKSRGLTASSVRTMKTNILHNRRHRTTHTSSSTSSTTKTALNLVGGGSESTSVFFNNIPLWNAMGIYGGVNALGFLISVVSGSHLHLDLLGTGAFAIASIPSLAAALKSITGAGGVAASAGNLRLLLSSSSVTLWGGKLALFLFYRALQVKHDARLDEQLETVAGTSVFWFISVVWGVVCSLPHTLGTTSSHPGTLPTTVVGMSMFTAGFLIETISDFQKLSFKNANPGQFCDAGLWSISQHPNYFGNLLLWSGILVMNAPALIDTPSKGVGGGILSKIWSTRRLFLAFLSPAFMWTLFYGQASGSMLNTVEAAMKRYGNDPKYIRYIENTPLIIPKFPFFK